MMLGAFVSQLIFNLDLIETLRAPVFGIIYQPSNNFFKFLVVLVPFAAVWASVFCFQPCLDAFRASRVLA